MLLPRVWALLEYLYPPENSNAYILKCKFDVIIYVNDFLRRKLGRFVAMKM